MVDSPTIMLWDEIDSIHLVNSALVEIKWRGRRRFNQLFAAGGEVWVQGPGGDIVFKGLPLNLDERGGAGDTTSHHTMQCRRMTEPSEKRPQGIPDWVAKWCAEHKHTEPAVEEGHWRAYPPGAVMSVPVPRGRRAPSLPDPYPGLLGQHPPAIRGVDGSVPRRGNQSGHLTAMQTMAREMELRESHYLGSLDEIGYADGYRREDRRQTQRECSQWERSHQGRRSHQSHPREQYFLRLLGELKPLVPSCIAASNQAEVLQAIEQVESLTRRVAHSESLWRSNVE